MDIITLLTIILCTCIVIASTVCCTTAAGTAALLGSWYLLSRLIVLGMVVADYSMITTLLGSPLDLAMFLGWAFIPPLLEITLVISWFRS